MSNEPETLAEASERLARATNDLWEAIGLYPAARWALDVILWFIQHTEGHQP